MNTYVTPETVAEELSITAKTVREWLKSGELIGVKVGSSWRIHRSDFERYREGQRLSLLMAKIRLKYPDTEWVEGQCGECGVYIPEPKNGQNTVCSHECKKRYDKTAASVVEIHTAEYLSCCGNVLPHF